MRISSVLRFMSVVLAAAALSAPSRGEPVVRGNVAAAAAIGDLMTTRMAELDRGGRARFRMLRTIVNDNYRHEVEGETIWGDGFDTFRGVVQSSRGRPADPAQAPKPGDPIARQQVGRLNWFRTPAEECAQNLDLNSVFVRSPPTDQLLLDLPLRPVLDAFHPNMQRQFFFADCCAPGPFLAEFSVSEERDGTTHIDTRVAADGYASRFTASAQAGGHITAYECRPPAPQNWLRGSISWVRGASGEWHPTRIQHDTFKSGSFSQLLGQTLIEIQEFDAGTTADPGPLQFSKLQLPVGTLVALARKDGARSYVVGGATGEQTRFEKQLQDAASALKAKGFAHPGRGAKR